MRQTQRFETLHWIALHSTGRQHWNTVNDVLASLNVIAISSNKSIRGEVKRFLKIKALAIHTQQTATPNDQQKELLLPHQLLQQRRNNSGSVTLACPLEAMLSILRWQALAAT